MQKVIQFFLGVPFGGPLGALFCTSQVTKMTKFKLKIFGNKMIKTNLTSNDGIAGNGSFKWF